MINPRNKILEKEYRDKFKREVNAAHLSNQEVMQAYKDAMKVALPVKVPKSKEEKKEKASQRQEEIDK